MRDEVDSVLQGRDPTFDDVPNMPYLRQVVSETLRLRPPAPLVARNVVEDNVIGDYAVKAGDAVWLLFWATHRHPDFWPDAETFDPGRFAPDRSADRHPWSYIPFSGGPRTCIGNMFALVEASILVAQLLRRFDVEVQSCADVTPVTVATTRSIETGSRRAAKTRAGTDVGGRAESRRLNRGRRPRVLRRARAVG